MVDAPPNPLALISLVITGQEDALDGQEAVPADPACVIVNVCPATEIEPFRLVPVRFAAIAYERLPVPLPLSPALIVIQLTLEEAVQGQFGNGKLRPTLAAPPLAEKAAGEDGLNVTLHPEVPDAPNCEMVKGWPETMIEPVRAFAEVFALTE
jgi:hypothetical protein